MICCREPRPRVCAVSEAPDEARDPSLGGPELLGDFCCRNPVWVAEACKLQQDGEVLRLPNSSRCLRYCFTSKCAWGTLFKAELTFRFARAYGILRLAFTKNPQKAHGFSHGMNEVCESAESGLFMYLTNILFYQCLSGGYTAEPQSTTSDTT